MIDGEIALEWFSALALVFGGCCSNVITLEEILKQYSDAGIFLTFIQFVYVTLQSLPSQLESTSRTGGKSENDPGGRFLWLRLKKRKVPITRWAVHVVLFFGISILNSLAFSYKVPVAIHIIFRSGGLCVSMFVSWLVGARKYKKTQVLAALMVTSGIIIATLYSPKILKAGPTISASQAALDAKHYALGLAILSLALVLSAFLGLWQEATYKTYGNCWEEGLFYQHLMSLPLFAPMLNVRKSVAIYSSARPLQLSFTSPPWLPTTLDKTSLTHLNIPFGWILLVASVATQGLCIRGVNKLTGQVSSVTVQLILTLRKAVSLAISVTFFGSGHNAPLVAGAAMVLAGTILYATTSDDKAAVRPRVEPSASSSGTDGAVTTAVVDGNVVPNAELKRRR